MESSMSVICEGCLSIDRKLTAIYNEESVKIFCWFLGSIHLQQALFLCWECSAILRKISSFAQQIRRAHNSLMKNMPHQTVDMSPLTKLSVSLLQADQWLDVCESAVQPMTFIKVEHNSNVDNVLFFDDVHSVGSDNCNDVDLKIDLTSDLFKSKEQFNDSDDEPLLMKKVKEKSPKVENKPRRKKKRRKEDRGEDATPQSREGGAPGTVVQPSVHSANSLKRLNMADNGYLQMVVLNRDEVEEERQQALQKSSFKKLVYRCYDCVLGFNHRFKLDNHLKKHEPEYGPEVCDICKVRCKHQQALLAHLRRHQVKWRCRLCARSWSRPSVAADHVSREHGAAAPTHLCSLCAQTFPTLNKLRRHVQRHSERVQCDQCQKTFLDRTALRNHLFIHNGDKEFSCPSCGKLFLFKRAMELHQLTHGPSAQIYCHTCDLSFKNEVSFKQHMMYSLKHVDPARLKYACQLCDKKFVKAKRLEEHNLAVHLKVTPVQCPVPGCNFACSSRPVLRTHARMLHRNVRARRDHVCDVCGKTYTSKAALAGHLRAHSGERPFRCARCPAAFGYEAALYNHTRLVHLRHKSGRGGVTNDVPQTMTIPPSVPVTVPPVAPTSASTVDPAVLNVEPGQTWPSVTPPPLAIPQRRSSAGETISS